MDFLVLGFAVFCEFLWVDVIYVGCLGFDLNAWVG